MLNMLSGRRIWLAGAFAIAAAGIGVAFILSTPQEKPQVFIDEHDGKVVFMVTSTMKGEGDATYLVRQRMYKWLWDNRTKDLEEEVTVTLSCKVRPKK